MHAITPVFQNHMINQRLGKTIHLKMESLQPSGSFKMRGMGRVCQDAVERGLTHLICSSGGNAGYSTAYVGRLLGVEVTIVVPMTTSETARNRIASQGAKVIRHGATWDIADQLARELVEETQGAYIHPFDNPLVWDGHATLVHELTEQIDKPDLVVLSVGGGGLLCGVAQGLHEVGWQDVPIMAIETHGTTSFADALKAKKLITLENINSIATTLGAQRVTQKALDWAQQHTITPYQVSDYDAVQACLHFIDDQRMLVEPACGAALSLMYDHADTLATYDQVAMIVCGGISTTLEQLQTWQRELTLSN